MMFHRLTSFFLFVSCAVSHIVLRVEHQMAQKTEYEPDIVGKLVLFEEGPLINKEFFAESNNDAMAGIHSTTQDAEDPQGPAEVLLDTECCVLDKKSPTSACPPRMYVQIPSGSTWTSKFTSYPSQGLNFLGLYLPLLSKGSILQLLFKDRLVGSIDLSHHAFNLFTTREIEQYLPKSHCANPSHPSVYVKVWCVGCVFDTYKLLRLKGDQFDNFPLFTTNHVFGFYKSGFSAAGTGSDSDSLIVRPEEVDPDNFKCQVEVSADKIRSSNQEWHVPMKHEGYFLEIKPLANVYYYDVTFKSADGEVSAVAKETRPYSIKLFSSGVNVFSHKSKEFNESVVVWLLKNHELVAVIRYKHFIKELQKYLEKKGRRGANDPVQVNFWTNTCDFNEVKVFEEQPGEFYSYGHAFGVSDAGGADPLVTLTGEEMAEYNPSRIEKMTETVKAVFASAPIKVASAGLIGLLLVGGFVFVYRRRKRSADGKEDADGDNECEIVNFDHDLEVPVNHGVMDY